MVAFGTPAEQSKRKIEELWPCTLRATGEHWSLHGQAHVIAARAARIAAADSLAVAEALRCSGYAHSATCVSTFVPHTLARCGSMWDRLDRYAAPLGCRRGGDRGRCPGGGLGVVAVRGEAAPGPQAHLTAPYRPRYSPDQRTAGQYLGGLGTRASSSRSSVLSPRCHQHSRRACLQGSEQGSELV